MKELKNKASHKLCGKKKKRNRTGLIAVYSIITVLVIFAITQCEVFTNDSGQIPTSDMGITAIDAPASVMQGESAEISVTIQNFGNQEVNDSVSVTLTDDTDRNTLTTEFVSLLAPDSARSFTYSWDTEEASIGEHILTAVHDYEDNEKSNDTTSVSVIVEEAPETESDIAVSEISAPSSARQGDGVSVEVTLQNMGDEAVSEEINITLEDLTDGVEIGTQTISDLEAGGTTTLTYNWDTEEASAGEHELQAIHDFEDDNSENNTATATITINEPQENDIAITQINAPDSATQGDEVDIEVTIENTGNRAVDDDINVTLEHQTESTTIETQTINGLQEGDSTTLTYSWDTGDASTGEHELQAIHDFEDDNSENNTATTTITLNEPQENDIAITRINAPTSATQGDEVDIEVTIENTGNQPVDDDINVTLENQTESTTIETQTINGLQEGDSTTLTYSWDTGDASTGEHELRATHDFEDDNSENNTATTTITLNEPQENDIAITRINAPTSATQGDEVDIEVTIENTGNQPVDDDINVTLENQTESTTIETQTINGLQEGDSTTLTYSWDTGDAATGEHELQAAHDFDDNNADNNSDVTVIVIGEQQENDLAITNVNSPSSVEQGEEIDIEVTVENTGNQLISENIDVILEDQTDGVTIGTQSVSGLEAGDSTVLTYSWDTGEASTGDHEIEAEHSFDDDNPGNNSGSTTVTVNEQTVIDIGLTNMSAASSVPQGENVTISITVENLGNTALPETVDVTLNNETTGQNIGEQAIGSLSAGSSEERTFIWETDNAQIGTHTLVASHNLNDDNDSNDSESTTITVEEPADISITDVSATPSSVIQGESVEVDVTIENTGEQSAEDFSVTLEDLTDDNTIETQSGNSLDPGDNTTLTFVWDTDEASSGEHNLRASNSFSDDTRSETVTVEEAVTDIAVTEVNAPSSTVQGETVDINVTVENTGNQPVNENIDVILEDLTDDNTVNTQQISGLNAGAAETLTFSWNTGDASIGEHELQGAHSIDDDNSDNDSETASIAVEEPADISITDISATPSSVIQGESVEVDVTIENTGEQPAEDFSVTLEDLTDDNTIETQSGNSLDPGDNTTLTFVWDTDEASSGEHNLRASNSFSDDTRSETVTVEEAVTDIAVTEVNAPSSTVQGETVDINVTIENTGNQSVEESFDVILEDVTDGTTINTQTVSGLDAESGTTLSYTWDTGDASTGEHELLASHTFDDGNSDNDESSAFTTVNEPLDITEIDPDTMEEDTSGEVTITGSGFEPGIEVTFENGNGPTPTASDITVNDSQTLSATVTTSGNGNDNDRTWDVRVTNPDNSTAVLENGFTITANDDDE